MNQGMCQNFPNIGVSICREFGGVEKSNAGFGALYGEDAGEAVEIGCLYEFFWRLKIMK